MVEKRKILFRVFIVSNLFFFSTFVVVKVLRLLQQPFTISKDGDHQY